MVCDDLTIEAAADGLRVTGNGCALSRRSFEALAGAPPDRGAGTAATPDAALDRAAEFLGGARAPVFVVAADVAGTRAALRLADRLGGVIDHPDSDGLFRSLRVQQDTGAFATTLSEVRNRADVVLVVGPDPAPAAPRFFERCLAPQHTLLGDAPLQRRVFRIGPPASERETGSAAVTELTCAMADLPQAIAVLCAALRGGTLAMPSVAAIDPAAMAALVDVLRSARYAVVVWAPALFAGVYGELVAQALLEIVRQLNRTTRATALALGGAGNLLGVNQVCIWQTGYPLRTSFGGGAPDHDPYRFDARRMIACGEADALVWVGAFGAAAVPSSDVPTLVLAPGLAPGAAAPDVHIPIGVPGIDHDGQVFRTDVVVALRLDALRGEGRPSAAQALAMIESRLASRDPSR